MSNKTYEQLGRSHLIHERKIYEQKREEYEKRGLDIPPGARVKMTDWAQQNGLLSGIEGEYTKIKNALRSKGIILVLKSSNPTPERYWAGFWESL